MSVLDFYIPFFVDGINVPSAYEGTFKANSIAALTLNELEIS
jgi:hypothetical protein